MKLLVFVFTFKDAVVCGVTAIGLLYAAFLMLKEYFTAKRDERLNKQKDEEEG